MRSIERLFKKFIYTTRKVPTKEYKKYLNEEQLFKKLDFNLLEKIKEEYPNIRWIKEAYFLRGIVDSDKEFYAVTRIVEEERNSYIAAAVTKDLEFENIDCLHYILGEEVDLDYVYDDLHWQLSETYKEIKRKELSHRNLKLLRSKPKSL